MSQDIEGKREKGEKEGEKEGAREGGLSLSPEVWTKCISGCVLLLEKGQIILITAPNSYCGLEYFNYEEMKSAHSATHGGNQMQPV